MGSFLTWLQYNLRYRFYASLLRAISGLATVAIVGGLIAATVGYIYCKSHPGATFSLPHFVSAKAADSINYVYYSPTQNLETIEADDLSRVHGHLYISMYTFTDAKIASTLVLLAEHGNTIDIYRDQEQYELETQRNNEANQMLLHVKNIHIRIKSRSRGLMHLKTYTDGQLLCDGSTNWSHDGLTRQDNYIQISNNADNIAKFLAYFKTEWDRSDNVVIQ